MVSDVTSRSKCFKESELRLEPPSIIRAMKTITEDKAVGNYPAWKGPRDEGPPGGSVSRGREDKHKPLFWPAESSKPSKTFQTP